MSAAGNENKQTDEVKTLIEELIKLEAKKRSTVDTLGKLIRLSV